MLFAPDVEYNREHPVRLSARSWYALYRHIHLTLCASGSIASVGAVDALAQHRVGAAGALLLLRALGLAHVEELPGGRTRISNLTIINYALYKLGPMREDRLTAVLLAVQAACSAAALLVRYQLAGLLYDVVR